ncbi:hypothetical protein NGRA_1482 [Nosema granulosis]|uniref:Uncharacterized protein n=1 Tax=Nosema granulosis TaxID=83296 RepID=A0A9P6KYK5_9MICR|nr:hypothetical protein NGRA_1482 [Nosema granulosis]
MMKSIARKAGLPDIVLISFVLNGLPDDVGGALLMNTQEALTWGYVYNACEGLDCSNRTSVNGKEGTRDELRDPLNMEGEIREVSGQERRDTSEDEIYKIKEQQLICYYCKSQDISKGNAGRGWLIERGRRGGWMFIRSKTG